ncbi:MAG: hypothetical protein LBF91_09395, partial [Azoarcus sp.]|nr:hypothetical protein [Azoarcus sp.]
MRLLSIFAALFLISLLLRGGAGNLATPGTPDAPEDREAARATPEMQESQEDFSALIFKPPYPMGHFDFESEHNFSIIEIEMKNLIVGKMDDSFKNTNHFCAVGYVLPRDRKGRKPSPSRREVVVYWLEGKILYRWAGGDPKAAKEDFYFARSLMFSPGISLDGAPAEGGDQPLEKDSASFTENVENVLADCRKHGKQYTIEPFTPPPRGFNVPRAPARPVAPPRPAPPRPAAPRQEEAPPEPAAPPPPSPEP